MKFTPLSSLRSVTAMAAIGAATMVGCADPAGGEGAESGVSAVADHGEAEDGHDHGGWWCAEHGVPEEECTRCDVSLVAQFKANDDWCEEHAVPDSQCFACDPALKDKFAARYEAKYGKLPPEPTDI